MRIDAYSVLIVLSVLVVLSYVFNFLAAALKIPSVLLLIASGIGLKYAADHFNLILPLESILLEILGVTGLIFIVLEASLDLKLERRKLPLIMRAFLSAFVLLGFTAGFIALLFSYYYDVSFKLGLVHAIPLSVISSAIAIPSVQTMSEDKREFVIYESTFSDILGIIAFNYFITEHTEGLSSILNFGWDFILVIIISIISTVALVFLLNHAKGHVRFFLTFAIIILIYSFSKYLHLPSLILVLCFGMVLNNFRLFNHPIIQRLVSFDRLAEVSKELKMMTNETAFIIRTFFFLLFGYSIDLQLLRSQQVLWMGGAIIVITILGRFIFLRYLLKIKSTPLMLIAPRGLITVLLFYSIPEHLRMEKLSEGILFIVIVLTGLIMTLGLLLNRQAPKDNIEDAIQ
jgi:Kef-type K+ transport system membrane component KefB